MTILSFESFNEAKKTNKKEQRKKVVEPYQTVFPLKSTLTTKLFIFT